MKTTIANIGPFEFFISRTYGTYHILPAAGDFGEPGFRPGITVVPDARDRLDMGEQKYHWIPILANDHEDADEKGKPIQVPGIASDLVRNEGLEAFGVFVCAGPLPTSNEMAHGHRKMLEHSAIAIQRADAEWARYHRHELIDDNARRACLLLGEEREWAYQVVKKVVCPVCSNKNLEGTAKCSNPGCGAVLDIDKCVRYGIITKAHGDELKALRGDEPLKTVKERPGRVAPTKTPGESPSLKATGRQLTRQGEEWTGDKGAAEDANPDAAVLTGKA